MFKKRYTPNWSTEVFKSIKVHISNPATYILEDMKGQPIKGDSIRARVTITVNADVYLVEKVLLQKGNNLKVRWLGFEQYHNSWIDANIL